MALSILENISLRNLTTFKVGGPARYFCEVTSEDELCEAIDFAKKTKNGAGKIGVPFFILAGGSNILVADEGFAGLVIRMAIRNIFFDEIDGHGKDSAGCVEVTVGAGQGWDAFVSNCVAAGLYGVENLSGIPGTVGAAPVQNIGAYGVEVKDVIQSVRVFDTRTNAFAELTAAECAFEYRDSIFKKESGRYIVTSVVFVLKKDTALATDYKDLANYFVGKTPTLSGVRKAVLEIRARKLPDVVAPDAIGTAGSFFKNPIITTAHYAELRKKYPDMPSYPAPVPAGMESIASISGNFVKIPLAWILDHVCGYKGVAKGNVGTYKNQALVIVNTGAATAQEIKSFAVEIAATVKKKTSIVIEPEVQYVPQ